MTTVPQLAPEPEVKALRVHQPDRRHVRPVKFLWERRIPIGKLSLLVGEEGAGKGTVLAWLAVQVIQGKLPGDRETPQRVLIIGDEDGFEDTWMPRMHAAGASWDEIEEYVITLDPAEELPDLTSAGPQLEAVIREHQVGWTVLDQVLDHIYGGKDGSGVYNPKHVRDALRPLRRAAKATDSAATGNLHPIKGQPKSFRDLIGGSHQFNAVSRSSLWLGPDPEDDSGARRVLVRGKGNLSEEAPCFEFEVVSHEFEHNGETFCMPVVINPREGSRYCRDFEGAPGYGFGKGTKTLAHELIAPIVFSLLTADEQSGSALRNKLAEQGENRSRDTITKSLQLLAEDGQAVKREHGWRLWREGDPKAPAI